MHRLGSSGGGHGHGDVQLQRDADDHDQERVQPAWRHDRGHSDEDHRDV